MSFKAIRVKSKREAARFLIGRLKLFFIYDSLVINNKSFQKHVVARIGADDVPTFLRRAIKAIITDELAVNLTWRGTALKPSIQQFTVFSVLCSVFIFLKFLFLINKNKKK